MPYDQTKKLLLGIGPTEEIISKNQQKAILGFKKRLVRRATSPERKFRETIAGKLLRRTDGRVQYVFQKEFLVSKGINWIVDFYFPKFKLVVEIDGDSHSSPDAKARDQWRDSTLLSFLGIATKRFTNEQVMSDPLFVWNETIRSLLGVKKATKSYREYLSRLHVTGKLPFIWPE